MKTMIILITGYTLYDFSLDQSEYVSIHLSLYFLSKNAWLKNHLHYRNTTSCINVTYGNLATQYLGEKTLIH